MYSFILLKPTKFLCFLQSRVKGDNTWCYLLISDAFYDTFLVESLWLANQLQKLQEWKEQFSAYNFLLQLLEFQFKYECAIVVKL